MIRFRYEAMAGWPPLAWLARCAQDSNVIVVQHGPRVETHDTWFGEAIWAGPYDRGDFDTTDIVFGSGARLRDRHITFVSAASTVDRLQSFRNSGGAWVSNSLPCLLAAIDAQLDPFYPHYFRDFRTIVSGLSKHRRTIETSVGQVCLTYFDNLRWDGRVLQTASKPVQFHMLRSFAQYRAFVDAALDQLVANMSARERSVDYRLLGTLSSGYDSPTVAALGRYHGMHDVLSFERHDLDPDSGAPLGRRLGLNVLRLRLNAWRRHPAAEIPFLAADAKGEDVYFAGAAPHLAGRVLLTGYHGDKLWGRDTRSLDANVVRSDQSGLSLTEYRLRAGFIHCPVPFLGVRQIRDINAISRSRDLEPWDVPGHYSRPICRRIVEDAGVPRERFGMEKRVSSVLFFDRETFLTPPSLADYRGWLTRLGDRHAGELLNRSRMPWRPAFTAAAHAANTVARGAPPALARVPRAVARRLTTLSRREPLFRYLFPWALERAKSAYPGAGERAAFATTLPNAGTAGSAVARLTRNGLSASSR